MVLAFQEQKLLIVRGAPTQVAGRPVGKVVPLEGEAFCPHCRRAKVQFLNRTRSSIKCWAQRVAVSRFRPRLLPAPASHLQRLLNGPATHRFPVHCAAAPAVASPAGPWCLKSLRVRAQSSAAQISGREAMHVSRGHVADLSVCRITNRCSGRHNHKVLIPMGRRAAAELNRWAHSNRPA